MRRVLLAGLFSTVGILVLILEGCGPCGMDKICKKNRETMPTLLTRMHPKEVVYVMKGEPYKKEYYKGKKGETIIVYNYLTNLQDSEGKPTDINLTPIFFVNYELEGWGSSYWWTVLKKYEPAF